MDSLENGLLKALKSENAEEFETLEDLESFMVELEFPFEQIRGFGNHWKKQVPDSVKENWTELPLSMRVLVWSMSYEIHSLNVSIHGFSRPEI